MIKSARSVRGIAASVNGGEQRAVEYAALALAAIERRDGELHAFLAVNAGAAYAQAGEVDRRIAQDQSGGPLAGVPIAVKDNICTLDFDTTAGSRILEGYRSPYEATVIRKLKAAGAVVVGKTNLDEFAMGSSTENSAYGPTRNPRDVARVPGGSSGGSAAAVASGMVPVALGSETGGSVRQPAAFCGIVGIKPSYGRVSRYGLIAFASSLDQIGTFGQTVDDAARVLVVISGHDPLDSTSGAARPPSIDAMLHSGLSDLVVGVPREYFPPELDPRIAVACQRALDLMRAEGAHIREVSLPHTRFAIPTYYIIAPAEASANLSRFDGVRYGYRARQARTTEEVYELSRSRGFGAEVKRRIMLGTYALSAGYYDAYYGRAQRMRARITQDFRSVFDSGVDVLFTPTTPTTAFRFGEKATDPYAMYLSDIFTVTANLAGLPGISLPIGEIDGLPVGGQFLADRWREDLMLRAAAGLEQALAT